jgi:nitroimidazol reductase NimA-like FMN-containing flavoprotein (pyridoxamine 5'-phosphate oxidase superfamily)
MLRRDREISNKSEIEAILHNCLLLHLAMSDGDQPYLVPLSYGFDGQNIYFHSARTGRKLDILKKNAKVCFQVGQKVELVTDTENACDWSFRYESVIGFGRAEELTDPGQRQAALNHIMQHYSGRDWTFPQSSLNRTSVWQIRIDEMSGKRSEAKGGGQN